LFLVLCVVVLHAMLDFDPLAGVRRSLNGRSLKGGEA
jgi:hypothetical protein